MVAIEFPFPFGTGPGHGRARGPPGVIHGGHTPVKPPVKPPVKTSSTATHTTKPATKGPGSSSSADAHHTTAAHSSAVPPPVTEVADPPSPTAVPTTAKTSALSTASSTSSITPSATLVSSKPSAVTPSTVQHAQVSTSASASADSTSGSAHGKNDAPAIAVGIIFAVIAVAAVAFLLFRRQQTRRRQARFPAWRADMRRSFIPAGLPEEVQTPISERTFVPVATAATVSKPLPPVVISPADRTSVSSAQSLIAPSTTTPSYVLSPVTITPGASTLNGNGSGWPTTPASAVFSQRENCIVRRTFVPTMPDELPVVMGDSVALVQEFDDGWATCVNQRGEQGVIPLECLQRVVDHSDDAAEQDGSACRLSKRCSSLNGVAGL